MSDNNLYAYSVARIRTIEKRLLSSEKLNAMVEAKTSDEALKVLINADYGDAGSNSKSVEKYEKLLLEESNKTARFIEKIAPKPEVFKMFMIKNDYQNIKILLKLEFTKDKKDGLINDLGNIPADELEEMIQDRNFESMTETMREAVLEAMDTFNRTSDPQKLDLILDRASYKEMLECAHKSKYPFLIELLQTYIDLTNISTFIRSKNLGKSIEFLKSALLDGGQKDKKFFVNLYDESYEVFIQALKDSRYIELCTKGLDQFVKNGRMTEFEKLSDNFIISMLKKTKHVVLGIEPLIAFLLAKEYEIKNARIIMVAKINNISIDNIRERLRDTYV